MVYGPLKTLPILLVNDGPATYPMRKKRDQSTYNGHQTPLESKQVKHLFRIYWVIACGSTEPLGENIINRFCGCKLA